MKVVSSAESEIKFDNGLVVRGDGEQDCCAVNYLDFEQLPVGTELRTMTAAEFLENITVKEDGFSIKDINEVPKWVQARSEQNGYYSNMTTLELEYEGQTIRSTEFYGDVE